MRNRPRRDRHYGGIVTGPTPTSPVAERRIPSPGSGTTLGAHPPSCCLTSTPNRSTPACLTRAPLPLMLGGHCQRSDRKKGANMQRTILLAGVLPFISAFLGGVLAFSFLAPPISAGSADSPAEVVIRQALAAENSGDIAAVEHCLTTSPFSNRLLCAGPHRAWA